MILLLQHAVVQNKKGLQTVLSLSSVLRKRPKMTNFKIEDMKVERSDATPIKLSFGFL